MVTCCLSLIFWVRVDFWIRVDFDKTMNFEGVQIIGYVFFYKTWNFEGMLIIRSHLLLDTVEYRIFETISHKITFVFPMHDGI